MILTDQDKLREEVGKLVGRFGSDRSAVLPVLQALQRKYSCVSDFAMQTLADLLGIHPVEVYGVVSFYSFLSSEPKGRFVVRLCRTVSCNMAGKDRVALQLINDLGIAFGKTTSDGLFTLEWANCLGMCDRGPAILINDEVHTSVTPEKVNEILAECRSALAPYAQQEQEEDIA